MRWQLSTPILALVLYLCTSMGKLEAAILANFIGGFIFFWVGQWIFLRKKA
jgi:hypothetical protein